MSQSGQGNHLADLQSSFLDDDYDFGSGTLEQQNNQRSPVDDAPLSPPRAEPDPVEVLPTHGRKLNEYWETGYFLDESFESLKLNGYGGLSSSEMSDSTFGTNDIGMDADPAQFVPKAINTMLMPEFANNRNYQAHSTLTPSQTSNNAETSPPWPQSDRWSKGSSTDLRPPRYTPRMLSTASHSQYSDSAWETIPSTPSADDYDLRPTPDDNSASMQSYNHPQTGIWPQENTYGRGVTYSPKMGLGFGNDNDYTAPCQLNEGLQKVMANADAATPSDTDSHSNGGVPLVNAALGAYGGAGTVDPSMLPPLTTGNPAPPLLEFPSNGKSKVFIVINDRMHLVALPVQRPPAEYHSFLPPTSDREILSNIAPGIVLDNPPLPHTKSPPATSVDTTDSTLAPPVEAGTLNTRVARCAHRGCGAKFKGATTKDMLRRHNRIVHGSKPKPVCLECHLVIHSGRGDNLKRHIMGQHPDGSQAALLKIRTKKGGSKTAASKNNGVSKSSRRST